VHENQVQKASEDYFLGVYPSHFVRYFSFRFQNFIWYFAQLSFETRDNNKQHTVPGTYDWNFFVQIFNFEYSTNPSLNIPEFQKSKYKIEEVPYIKPGI
jgi:hypothetical protein